MTNIPDSEEVGGGGGPVNGERLLYDGALLCRSCFVCRRLIRSDLRPPRDHCVTTDYCVTTDHWPLAICMYTILHRFYSNVYSIRWFVSSQKTPVSHQISQPISH